jgi:hypothetical protein
MTAGLLVLASPLLLGACTSSDEVRRAQATADQALATAQQASQAAQIANQQAGTAVTAAAANAKADRMYQKALKK